jgi:hypothetical protein
LKSAVVLAADNVASYLEDTKTGDLDSVRGLPNIAPPLNSMFIEFRLPKPVGELGWYFSAFERTDDGYLPTTGLNPDDVADAKWMLRGMFYMRPFPKRPQMWCQVFVKPNGALCEIGGKLAYYLRPTVGSIYTESWDRNPYGQWMLPPAFALHIALWTLCFMHTKNVQTEQVEPPEKLNKAHMKRHREPLSVYRVLRITPMGRGADREGQGGTHSPSSLHICRGHFKHYTEDAPLLGRAVGTYWWSQTLRGRRTQGTVQKDYEVQP